jgi:hypothetical protein
LTVGQWIEISSRQYTIMTKSGKKNHHNAGVTAHDIRWCDLRCEHADFAKQDSLDGSCRTFQSLWCRLLEKHVTKNAPCEKTFGARRPTTGW